MQNFKAKLSFYDFEFKLFESDQDNQTLRPVIFHDRCASNPVVPLWQKQETVDLSRA
jgi:hypothetical protein